jgi:hypothetical protein
MGGIVVIFMSLHLNHTQCGSGYEINLSPGHDGSGAQCERVPWAARNAFSHITAFYSSIIIRLHRVNGRVFQIRITLSFVGTNKSLDLSRLHAHFQMRG